MNATPPKRRKLSERCGASRRRDPCLSASCVRLWSGTTLVPKGQCCTVTEDFRYAQRLRSRGDAYPSRKKRWCSVSSSCSCAAARRREFDPDAHTCVAHHLKRTTSRAHHTRRVARDNTHMNCVEPHKNS